MSAGLAKADPTAKTIVDITGQHFGFLDRLAADGVTWNITGEHYYAAPNSPDLNSGAAALFSKLATYGRPIALTEFNQQQGGLSSVQSEATTLVNMMKAVASVSSQDDITSAYVYELLDEPQNPADEADYGLASATGQMDQAGQAVENYLAGSTSAATASAAAKISAIPLATTTVSAVTPASTTPATANMASADSAVAPISGNAVTGPSHRLSFLHSADGTDVLISGSRISDQSHSLSFFQHSAASASHDPWNNADTVSTTGSLQAPVSDLPASGAWGLFANEAIRPQLLIHHT
jgi:hypothetical protein